ncbi:MAG: hypothetical protein IJU77_05850 [Butyrivibrio sp.]|nr:hypothetical protein [Butyrivibrio sp.]
MTLTRYLALIVSRKKQREKNRHVKHQGIAIHGGAHIYAVIIGAISRIKLRRSVVRFAKSDARGLGIFPQQVAKGALCPTCRVASRFTGDGAGDAFKKGVLQNEKRK